jgi:hypothetical protein
LLLQWRLWLCWRLLWWCGLRWRLLQGWLLWQHSRLGYRLGHSCLLLRILFSLSLCCGRGRSLLGILLLRCVLLLRICHGLSLRLCLCLRSLRGIRCLHLSLVRAWVSHLLRLLGWWLLWRRLRWWWHA